MNHAQVLAGISNCFNVLWENEYLYDLWMGILYTEDGDLNYKEWNETNFYKMQDDVYTMKTL